MRTTLAFAIGLLHQVEGNFCVDSATWVGDRVMEGTCANVNCTSLPSECDFELSDEEECESSYASASSCCTNAGGTYTATATCDDYSTYALALGDVTDCSNAMSSGQTVAQFIEYVGVNMGCCGGGDVYCVGDNGPVPQDRLPDTICEGNARPADLRLEAECSGMTREECEAYVGDCYAEWDSGDAVCKFSMGADVDQCCTSSGGQVTDDGMTCAILGLYVPSLGGCDGQGGVFARMFGQSCCPSGLTCDRDNALDFRVYSAAGCAGGYRVYSFVPGVCTPFPDDDVGSVLASLDGDVVTPQFFSDDSCQTEVVGPMENRTGTKSFTKGLCVDTTNPVDADDNPNESFMYGSASGAFTIAASSVVAFLAFF